MRSIRTLLRRVITIALPLAVGCNAIIGMDGVSLETPDAGAICDVNSSFGLVNSNPATSILRHTASGAVSLLLLLNTDAKPDSLGMLLYNNMGGHGILNAPGSYLINTADSRTETCGICLGVYADFNSSTSMFSQTYMAKGQGTLTLTTADNTKMVGRLQGLKFRRVDISGATTQEINDGCMVTIDDVHFDLPYAP
ncbi:MAG TPA: hypothetical protein VN253_23800 [Kofleriaceae bacterium]|nr:hypothetical protein [Kofleriaceae bacterium]